MDKTIDYYHSLMSPYSYMGAERLGQIAERAGARVVCKPVDYGQIFPVSGGLPVAKRAPQRQAYRFVELKRWRDHLGVPLNLEPKFWPVREALAARLVIAARESGGDALALSSAVLRGVWAEEHDIADRATLAALAEAQGHQAEALLAAAESPEIEARYQADTDEAIARGIFGAPTYVYRDEPFWGQDRLDFLARVLDVEPA